MVFGGPWSSNCTIEAVGPDTRTITPLKVTPDCVTFACPEEWPRTAFAARIGGDVGATTIQVNAPDVWWMQGDSARDASPGGWLRVFGRSICYGDKAFVELKPSNAKAGAPADKRLPGTGDLYAMRVDLPTDLPPGTYDVFLNNGLLEESVPVGAIAVASSHPPWPEKVFNVVHYGATPNDRCDDSRAILAALADVAANNGGILYFPRGRFGMTGTIELPPNTLLRGAGMALSQIYWIDEDDPHGPLVAGTFNFGVTDIALVAGNIGEGIVTIPPAEGDAWKNDNILLSRVRTRFLHTDAATTDERSRRARQNATALRIDGRFVRIYDCDFVTTKGAYSVRGDYLHVRGNVFQGSGQNQSLSFTGTHIIWENNDHESSSTTLANASRCVYFCNNRLGAIYGDGDRETFTFDGGGGAYSDKIESADGRTVTLKPLAWRHGAREWIGKSLYVIGGKGAGQVRTVTKIDGRSVQIDRPWDIDLDDTSHVVIAKARRKLLFIGNHDRDGNPFQLYGSAIDVVLADNVCERNSGLQAFGMTKGGWPEPSWFIQFIGNEIIEGNSVRGPWSFMVPAADSRLAFFDRGIAKPLMYPQARVGVMRRNVLRSNAYIYGGPRVENLLVENNIVEHADKGVVVRSKGAVLRGNRFEDVVDPLGAGTAAVQAQQPLPITQWLVAGPFKNESGKAIDTAIHPPEMNLDVTQSYDTLDGRRPWIGVTTDTRGRADLAKVFTNTDMATVHAVALVRASKPVRVNVPPGGRSALLYVNGRRIGSSARRDAARCVELQAGDNLIHLITSHTSDAWPLSLTLKPLDPVEDGDLQVVPCDELTASPLLRAADGMGRIDPATAAGVDWQLVVADNFDRARVGEHWQSAFKRPSYIHTGMAIEDGALRCHGGAARIAYAHPTPAPVRMEFDVWLETARSEFSVTFGPYRFAPLGIGQRTLIKGSKVIADHKSGVYPGVTTGEWHHVVIQFVPPRCQFFFDGVRKVDYEDPEWVGGADRLTLSFATTVRIDNLQIYGD